MDAVLTSPTQTPLTIGKIFELMSEAVDEDLYDDDYKLSLWVKERSVIRASGELHLMSKLEPGVYIVESSRELGPYCEKLTINSDELFILSNSITEKLFAEIDMFWKKDAIYKEQKLTHKRGIILAGFPGVGKSSIITQLSDKIIKANGVVFKVSGFRNLDLYVNFLRTSFRVIQPDTPVVTILEGINQYSEVEEELLDFFDGKTQINHHVIIATTNNMEEIPDTFLRPSRIDLKIEVPLPDLVTRLEYFEYKGVSPEIAADLAAKTSDFSLADLKEVYICIYLLDYSMEDAINKIKKPFEKKNYSQNPQTKSKMGL